MHLTVHTKYGVFHSEDEPYSQEAYDRVDKVLGNLSKTDDFSFNTPDGEEVFMSKELIQSSLFVLSKESRTPEGGQWDQWDSF